MEKVLVTGGTGLVGSCLVTKLRQEGYEVAVLSRSPKEVHEYKWDIAMGFIDERALLNVSYIIHLAGAGIADKRWTKTRKKVLLASRVESANLLFEKVKALNIPLKGFISASGIGYYGAVTSTKVFKEEDVSGNDFIAQICVAWEKAANQFKSIKVPVTIFRTGIVLSNNGGALQKMNTPFFLSALGNGKQIMPWIHIDDLVHLFMGAIKQSHFKGVFNAVANNSSNSNFTKVLGKVLHKFVLPIALPALLLKLMLGELAVILLKGTKVSSKKVMSFYQFKFDTLKETLEDLCSD